VRRFLLLFLLAVFSLYAIEATKLAQDAVIAPFTADVAAVSAWLLQLFDGDVAASGATIWNPASGFAVTVEAGCNGVEASLVLLAAVIAYPASWHQKVVGVAGGVVTVQVLNLARIISLFYLGQWNQTAFEWAHLYLWQALIMLDVLLIFLVWLRWVTPPASPKSGDRMATE